MTFIPVLHIAHHIPAFWAILVVYVLPHVFPHR
jgi:hypothetical protein